MPNAIDARRTAVVALACALGIFGCKRPIEIPPPSVLGDPPCDLASASRTQHTLLVPVRVNQAPLHLLVRVRGQSALGDTIVDVAARGPQDLRATLVGQVVEREVLTWHLFDAGEELARDTCVVTAGP